MTREFEEGATDSLARASAASLKLQEVLPYFAETIRPFGLSLTSDHVGVITAGTSLSATDDGQLVSTRMAGIEVEVNWAPPAEVLVHLPMLFEGVPIVYSSPGTSRR